LPSVRGLPNGSIEESISSFRGDLALIALMAVVPSVLNNVDVLRDTVPHKWRRFTRHFDAAARVSGLIYMGNVFDAVFATVAERLALDSSTAQSILFLLLWWIPSRLALGKLLYQRLQWIQNGRVNEQGFMNRAVAVVAYFGLALLVSDGLKLAVSQVMGFAIMPGLVALLQAA